MTKSKAQGAPPLEWAMGALGALLFVAILGIVVWHGLTDKGRAPSIRVEVTSVELVAGGYVARFEARNDGDMTAAELRIVAELSAGSAPPEAHEVTLDFLPPRSTRQGGFFFERDPRIGSLKMHADGYTDP